MDQTTHKFPALLILTITLLSPPLLCEAEHLNPQISGEIGVIGGSVSRSTFTNAVVNREPKNHISELPNNRQFIYYFTELKGMAGQTVTHRWLYNNTTISEVKFNVGSTRWRVWSSTTLKREWLGTWEVQVVNEMNQVVHRDSFNYIQSSAVPDQR